MVLGRVLAAAKKIFMPLVLARLGSLGADRTTSGEARRAELKSILDMLHAVRKRLESVFGDEEDEDDLIIWRDSLADTAKATSLYMLETIAHTHYSDAALEVIGAPPLNGGSSLISHE